jgi:hypothetical protein
MSKEKLLAIIKKILRTDEDLSFLFRLEDHELSKLVVLMRQVLDRQSRS